ncbi:MAG: response regulator, partial [Thiotrichales bacterium]
NVYGRDDTEQKRSERDLLEAKQAAEAANIAKSRFLATISHEVRTPLNGVLGMLELLLKTDLSSKQRGFTENAIHSGKGLLGLINDILDFSKIESNKLKLDRFPFNIEDPIHDTLQVVTEEANRKNLELITEIVNIDQQLIGDEQRLRQILINLIGNAVKFTDHGFVKVRVEQTAVYKNGLQLKFEVSDSGIGITTAAQPHIFKDFTQQDGSTTRKFGGTGLGLAITKQLVNMMGGEIHMQSTPGEGSSFWLTLQFETMPQQKAAAIAQVASPTVYEHINEFDEIILDARILLAEDNAINQEVASAMLESAGCEVVAVDNGLEALHMLESEHFDLVLMDCQMPTMDGFEATRTIRRHPEKYPPVPIIALTADIQQGITEQCRQAGMNDYLSKPFTYEALVEIIMNWLPDKACREA